MVQSDCIDHGCKGYGLGYATAKYQGRYTTKHRVVLLRRDGLDFDGADGLVVRHLCDNARCINPEHLEWGSHQDNMEDMKSRGRSARISNAHPGESNGRCVLSDAECIQIKRRYVKGCRANGLPALAKLYGVSTSQIHRIVKGIRNAQANT